MHFTCRSFIGPATADVATQATDSWSQFWENEPDDPSVYLSKGHLFGLISTDSPTSGRQFIDLINQQYFSSPGSDVAQNLAESIKGVTATSLSLVAAVNGQLYLLQYQSGYICLKRQGQVSLLLQGKPGPPSLLTGRFQHLDWLFMASQNFTWQQSKSFFNTDDLSVFEDNLRPKIFSAPHSSFLAAALIQFNVDDHTLDTPPVPEPSQIPPYQNNNPAKKSRLASFIRSRLANTVYVSPRQLMALTRRRRFYLVFSLVLLLLLGTIFYLGFTKNRHLQAEKQFAETKLQIDQKLSDALAVKNLNLDSAQKLATQAQEYLKNLEAINIHPDEVDNYRRQIESLLSQTGASDTWHPDTFYDTSLITSSSRYSHLLLSGSNLYLFDPENGRLDLLNTDSKSIKNLITNPDLKSYTSFFEDSSRLYVYNDRQISLIDSGKIDRKITASDILVVRPWNHALYALTATSSAVIKYTPTSTGFDGGKAWLSAKPEFTPVSMAINGRIWLLSSTGQIAPFTRGVADSFTPQATIKFETTNHLSVSLEDTYLAFVDVDHFVYVYKKDGSSYARYNFGDLKILDISLSATSPDLYVLCSDQKIYKITL